MTVTVSADTAITTAERVPMAQLPPAGPGGLALIPGERSCWRDLLGAGTVAVDVTGDVADRLTGDAARAEGRDVI